MAYKLRYQLFGHYRQLNLSVCETECTRWRDNAHDMKDDCQSFVQRVKKQTALKLVHEILHQDQLFHKHTGKDCAPHQTISVKNTRVSNSKLVSTFVRRQLKITRAAAVKQTNMILTVLWMSRMSRIADCTGCNKGPLMTVQSCGITVICRSVDLENFTRSKGELNWTQFRSFAL